MSRKEKAEIGSFWGVRRIGTAGQSHNRRRVIRNAPATRRRSPLTNVDLRRTQMAKWRRRLREPGNEQLLAKYLEKEKLYHKSYVAKRAAAKLEHLTESAGRRDLFTQEVPGILGSRCRTRLFIALCEYGPLSGVDISRYVMAARGGPRDNAVNSLVALGVVAVHMPKHKARTIYYLNPGIRPTMSFSLLLVKPSRDDGLHHRVKPE